MQCSTALATGRTGAGRRVKAARTARRAPLKSLITMPALVCDVAAQLLSARRTTSTTRS